VADLLALPQDAFLARLGQAFGTRLGSFTTVSARHAFPLLRNDGPATTARTVAIGNAAQTLHPVAGQGLNLGLRDALVLAAHLGRASSPEQLRAFMRERAGDRSTTIRLTDSLARVFASAPAGAWSQTLLGASLGMVDVLQPAKRALAEQMMFGRRG
jgi:2-octaprenyl-6-methoxyphenol hydroxylase